MTIAPGLYHITKEVTVNDSALLAQWNTFKASNTCIKNNTSFFNTIYDSLKALNLCKENSSPAFFNEPADWA